MECDAVQFDEEEPVFLRNRPSIFMLEEYPYAEAEGSSKMVVPIC